MGLTTAKQVSGNNERLSLIFTALIFLAAFLVLYIFRSLDNNTLTSWQWVFAAVNLPFIFSVLLAGLVLAYGLSRVPFPVHQSLWLIFFLAVLVTVSVWREPEVIVDASRYFVQAKYLELHGVGYFLKEWGGEIPAWTDMPLVPFLYGVIFRIFGENRLGIQILSTLLFSTTAVLTCLIGKVLWNKETGFYAGLLLLGMPYLIVQVPLMMVDVAAMFFLTLAVLVTIKAVNTENPLLWLAASIAIALAMLTKYSVWLLLSVVPIIFLVMAQCRWKVALQRAVFVMGGALLFVGVFVLWKLDVVIRQFRLLYSFQLDALGKWQESFLSTFFFQIHPFISIAALIAIFVAIKKRDLRFLIVAWMLLLIFVLGIKRIRYMLPAMPMLALMAAYGLAALSNQGLRKFIVAIICVSSVTITVFAYLPFLRQVSAVNLAQAGKYLDKIEAASVEVLVLPPTHSSINPLVAVPLLDYSTKQKIIHRDERVFSTPKSVEKLPLRWTWEYQTPSYLLGNFTDAEDQRTVVIIQSDPEQLLPENIKLRISDYTLLRAFEISDSAFRYQTIVKVYSRASEL